MTGRVDIIEQQVAQPKFLRVQDPTGRTLLTLEFTADGRLSADFDPADLDEAAVRFVAALTSLEVVRR